MAYDINLESLSLDELKRFGKNVELAVVLSRNAEERSAGGSAERRPRSMGFRWITLLDAKSGPKCPKYANPENPIRPGRAVGASRNG
jgi:hypothetical protein